MATLLIDTLFHAAAFQRDYHRDYMRCDGATLYGDIFALLKYGDAAR